MNQSLPRLASITMAVLLVAGCSSKGEPKTPKAEPSRPAETVIQSLNISQAKNNIMSACSAKRLQIHTSRDEVTCAQSDISGQRKREIERLVNDEFATNIQIVTQFKLTEQGANVGVTANIFAQYLAPVSVTSGPQIRTRNLVDDLSFNEMSALLDQATQGGKSFK
jgi:PBP1b-binding outer membrane lipoprotein LpoB